MKNKIIAVMTLTVLLCCLTGCKADKQKKADLLVIGSDMVDINVVVPSEYQDLGFDIPVLWRNEKAPTFKLLDVKGENISLDEVEISDDTIKDYKDVTFDDCYLSLIGVKIYFQQRVNFTIESMKVQIYGKEYDIVFDKKIQYRFADDNKEIEQLTTPDVILPDNSYDLLFSFETNKQVHNVKVDVSKQLEYKGLFKGEEQQPITTNVLADKIGKGEQMSFRLQVDQPAESKYMSGAYNVVLNYQTKSNEEKTCYYMFNKQCVSAEEDVEAVIRHLYK